LFFLLLLLFVLLLFLPLLPFVGHICRCPALHVRM